MQILADKERVEIIAAMKNGDGVAFCDLLEEMLSRVLNKAIESSLTGIPHVITNLMRHRAGLEQLKKAFFESNSDLIAHQDQVMTELAEVQSEQPGWNYDELVAEAGKRTRLKLSAIGNTGRMDTGEAEKPSPEQRKKISHGVL